MSKQRVSDLSDLHKLIPGMEKPDDKQGEVASGDTSSRNDRTRELVKLHVQYEKKGRRGKGVTVIRGFHHNKKDMQDFARRLKSLCGSGGTVKNDAIELQGEHGEKAASFFRDLGFNVTGGKR